MSFDTVATRASALLRNMGSFVVKGRASLRGQAFICETLQGDGHPGVCVNSDLTLSCGCRDTNGTGRLGDLTQVNFQEAFQGKKAEHFRRELAEGRIPTSNCVRCRHLMKVSRAEAQEARDQVKLPHSIMVENTSVCNLRCLSCRRDTVRKLRKRRMMSLEDIDRLALDIREMGVRALTYHHLGEPFLSKRLGEELQIIRQHNPGIRIQVSTNGMMLKTDAQREAALLFDHIQFSLDGVNQAMVERYQRGSHFETVYENMKQLVAYRDARGLDRPVICWKYLLFRWTEKRRYQLQAIELARDAKVDELWLEPTVSPFYGLPWRTLLGANRDLGIRDGNMRYVPVRKELEAQAATGDGSSEIIVLPR